MNHSMEMYLQDGIQETLEAARVKVNSGESHPWKIAIPQSRNFPRFFNFPKIPRFPQNMPQKVAFL